MRREIITTDYHNLTHYRHISPSDQPMDNTYLQNIHSHHTCQGYYSFEQNMSGGECSAFSRFSLHDEPWPGQSCWVRGTIGRQDFDTLANSELARLHADRFASITSSVWKCGDIQSHYGSPMHRRHGERVSSILNGWKGHKSQGFTLAGVHGILDITTATPDNSVCSHLSHCLQTNQQHLHGCTLAKVEQKAEGGVRVQPVELDVRLSYLANGSPIVYHAWHTELRYFTCILEVIVNAVLPPLPCPSTLRPSSGPDGMWIRGWYSTCLLTFVSPLNWRPWMLVIGPACSLESVPSGQEQINRSLNYMGGLTWCVVIDGQNIGF